MSKSIFPRTAVEETPTRPRRTAAPMPRWVMVLLVILLLVVLLFVILHFTGNGMGSMHMSFLEERGHVL